ncbi:hypothetical protein ALC62_05983 [Cyphomyrmex costatus]|uniref:RNA polymerase II elongation factor ELL N-terminal domain-containing protein n=1 Tax=Cyphomyrmex costatus TaxID=456900 RepID=A0A195CQY3_9HYME|nr:hypothetical protein ALC62_05983 [Cyphomyrmex costatus]
MGDEEMALVPDVQYGLSSHGNFEERKSLIFVKLTDSSQRAIKEYLKIKHAHTRIHTRVHVLSACTNRTCTYMRGGRMNSLEFAAREKVNQLAVLANFSSWRSERTSARCVPAYLLRTGNRASSHADYACARRAIN